MDKVTIIIFVFCLLHAFLFGEINNYRFDRLTEDDGLSDDVIEMIYQDKYGFMWFGTVNGLNRYDGYKFTIFTNDPNDAYSIGHNHVNSCYEDKNGNLWFLTHGGGLAKYDYSNDRFTNYQYNPNDKNSICSNYCFSIYEHKEGNFWVSTMGGLSKMIFHPKEDSVTFVNYLNDPQNEYSLKNNHVWNVWEPEEGFLWIATNTGLNIFDIKLEKFHHSLNWGNTWLDLILKNYKIIFPNSLKDINKADSLILRKYNYFYEFHPKNGLLKVNYKILADSLDIPLSDTDITYNFKSKSGDLWILTAKNGIYIYNKQKKIHHITYDPLDPFSLCNNNISRIFEDRSGSIWIGHTGGGISKYNPNHFKFAYYDIKLNSQPISVTSIITENSQSDILWIGTARHGLLRYNSLTGTIKQYKSPIRNIVNKIYQDPENSNFLWIGTFGIEPAGGGLYRFNKKKESFKRFYFNKRTFYEEEFCRIRTIIADTRSRYWITTGNGLFRFDPILTKIFRYPADPLKSESLTDNNLTSIIETNSNGKTILWIGSLYGGINVLEPGFNKFFSFKHIPGDTTSISSNWVKSLFKSKDGKIWAGTDKGLDLFDPLNKTFKHLIFEDRRLNGKIFGIYEGTNANLWFYAENVLARYNYISREIDIFEAKYDFPLNSFNPNSHHQSSGGKLFFGGPGGFISFHPDSIKVNTNLPSIIFTDFRIYNKSIKPGQDSPLISSIYETEELYLNHDQSVFSLEFTALEYTIPEKNRYAYKMEGVDPNWVYTDATQRFATYTNLDPGTYTFSVKACNNDGVWNEEGTSIKITILPPWWRTNLAYISYFVFFISLLLALRHYDLKRQRLKHQLEMERKEAEKLHEIDRMKSRFFANISHELRTPLTLILGPIKKWLPQLRNRSLKQDMQMMQRNANRLHRLINQMLDLSKLESGGMTLQARDEDMVLLLREYVQSFESLAKIKQISLKFLPKLNSIIMQIDRDKIEKIVYNLLSNAFKFTPEGGEIELKINTTLPSASPLNSGEEIWSPLGKGDLERCIVITISNTGSYIPPEIIDHIFDRFYQADDSPSRGFEGSGIGLALTRELVELHHGQIKVESTKENGTSFTIKLPIRKVQIKASEKCKSLTHPVQPMDIEPIFETDSNANEQNRFGKGLPLIMIVEDSPDVRFHIRGYIESNYRIVEAVHGTEGLKKAIEKIPDLIISDVMMPEMDGFELCRKLKSDERTSHIPVILLTARAESQDKIDGLETGADDYLIKPFDAKELLVRIKNLISQREKLRNHYIKTFSLEYSNTKYSSIDQLFLGKVKLHIEEHLANSEYSISEFAREVGFSHSQLIRKLENLTGLKPSLFIRSYRLLRAKQMLDQKSGNISQIAYECGFSNLSYFSRSFKAQFGELPSDYIKHISSPA